LLEESGVNETPLEVAEMLRWIEREADFFYQHASSNEVSGRLQAEVINKLLDLGVFHAMVPRSLGGSGLDAIGMLRIIEALSRADASIGWVAMAVGFCTSAAAAYLSDECAAQIFAPGVRGLVAGAGAPTGVARVVPGGFEVSGRWRYGSGILHAEWAHGGVLVEKDGVKIVTTAGTPAARIAYIPLQKVQLLGNWDVIGLRGTGSVDFSVANIFVPEDFTIDAVTPKRQRGDLMFGHSLTLGTLIGHCGWAMGTSRRLLDELACFARTGNLRSGSLANNHAFLEDYARHEAAVRAARAFTYESWLCAQRLINANTDLPPEDLTLIRLALVHVTNAATDAANFAFRAAGGETLRQGPLQRMCRDILAGGQHITSSPPVMQACGRMLAGLAHNEIWAVNSLIKSVKT
jgi:indole-3-acetate monooxygenase